MSNRANAIRLWATATVVVLGAMRVWADQGLQLESPYLERYHSPLRPKPYRNPLQSDSAAVLKTNTNLFTDDEDIDFEKRQVTFSKQDKLGFQFWVYHYGELSDYLFGATSYSLYQGWYRDVATVERGKEKKRTPTALDFALPIQYPKWAQRVLGKEPPKLSLDGYLKLIVSYDGTRHEPETELSTESSGFQFDQESRFTIRGSIGRVIDISITAGSEEELEWENQLKKFKIEYKGEGDELEDEIIQEITAGYTDFQMPGQGLAGYSESHEGLFGIKIRSKLGPLILTTIASHEQGEAQEQVFNRGGPSISGTTVHNESDYVKYKFFFLDTAYLRHWTETQGPAGRESDPVPLVRKLQLWKSVQRVEISERDPRFVYREANLPGGARRFFRQLKDYEYMLDEVNGWVRIDSVTLQEQDVLAMFLRTEDPSRVPNKGDTTVVFQAEGQDTVMKELAFLKDENPTPEQESFVLAWRNVYTMPRSPDAQSFYVKVQHHKVGADTVEYFGGKLISEILGLTDSDGKVDFSSFAFDNDFGEGYMVLPPFPDTLEEDVIGNQPFRNYALGDSVVPDIYTKSRNDLNDHRDDYTITMPGSAGGSRDEDPNKITGLGWGVIDKSDKVVADGIELERNRDYVIDYAMGTIELISPRARAAQNVKVTYQREALFVPEEKVFLGAHGRVDLPFLGKNTFAGASIMWQDASSSEKTPRIGQEPYSRFLLDINTSMDFEPEWMTKAFSWFLPGVRPDEQSNLKFDIEVAHSRMNPNTDGEAFVEDFEASAQIFPLSQSERNWRRASPPAYLVTDTTVTRDTADTAVGTAVSKILYNPPAWQTYWFQPLDNDTAYSLRRKDLFDTTSMTNDEKATREHVLHLFCTPAPADDTLRRNFVNPWTGIMTNIPSTFADRSEDKYLEVLVKNNGGGELNIDFGIIAEDLCLQGGKPNKEEDTEDPSLTYEPNAALDVGLDGLLDTAEYYLVPNLDSLKWDTLRHGDPRLLRPEDPSGDNWKKYTTEQLENRVYTNGLQGNGGVPNSEDINLDASMVRTHQERYFRATIDLNALNAMMANYGWDISEVPHDSLARYFIARDANVRAGSRWVKLRIPLQDTSIVRFPNSSGTMPSLKQIEGVRLFWTDFDTSVYRDTNNIILTGIQFVGNQWQVVRSMDEDSVLSEVKIEASAVNNKEDQDYLESASSAREQGLDLYWDRAADKSLKREQALELKFWDLEAGEAALVERIYTYRTFDLSNYRELSMLVHSDRDLERDSVRFIFRFGGDSATYYEYRTAPLQQGWFGNEVNITLSDLTDLKLQYLINHGEDSLGLVDTLSEDGHFRLYASAGRLPTFSNIAWMALGVLRQGSSRPGPLMDSSVIWVNEMKVTGVRELNGWAVRTSLSTHWADFMDLSMSAEYTDADFRTMTEDLFRESNSVLKGAMDVTWHLDKFLPDEWGVSVPLGTTVSGSLSRPTKKPNTDIDLTDNGQPDRLSDMFVDAVRAITGSDEEQAPGEITESEHYQKTHVSRSWYTSYEKAAKSDKTITKLTAERIKANYNYRYDLSSEGRGARPEPDSGDYVDTTLTESYTGKLSYDLSPRQPPKWTEWRPFEDIKTDWFPKPLKDYELNLLPSKLHFSLLDARYETRYERLTRTGIVSTVQTFDVSHGLSLAYKPIDPLLDMSYNVDVSRGMDEALERSVDGDSWGDRWGAFIAGELFAWHADSNWARYGLLRGEENRTQDFKLQLKPQFFDWLTHDFSYSSDYSEKPGGWQGDSLDYYNLSVGTKFTFRSTLNMPSLFRGMADRTKKVEWLNKTFGGIEKALTKVSLGTISFNYNASSDLQNNTVGTAYLDESGDAFDFFLYTLGIEGRGLGDIMTGDMKGGDAYGGMRHRVTNDGIVDRYKNDTRTTTQDFSLSSSMNIPDPVGITINPLSLSWDRRYSVKPDSLWWDTTVVWPKFSVGVSSTLLDKIGFVKKHMQSVSLSADYSYQKERSIRGFASYSDSLGIEPPSGASTTEQHNWRPLVKINGRLKKYPISMSYEHGYSTQTQSSETVTRTKSHTDNISITYDLPKSTKKRSIKLFKWEIPIQGKFNVGATGERTHDIEWRNMSADSTDEAALDDESNATTDRLELSLTPKMGYVFTNSVKGTLQYTGKYIHDKVADQKTYSHLFDLIIEITF